MVSYSRLQVFHFWPLTISWSFLAYKFLQWNQLTAFCEFPYIYDYFSLAPFKILCKFVIFNYDMSCCLSVCVHFVWNSAHFFTWISVSFFRFGKIAAIISSNTFSIPLLFLLPLWLRPKASACNVGDEGLIPVLGRSPGEGNGNPLQYFYLENSVDQGD